MDARRVHAPAIAAVGLAALTFACDSQPTGLPPELDHIEVVSGADQEGLEGASLPSPVVVRAIDVGGARSLRGLYVRVASGEGQIGFPGRRAAGNGVVLASPDFGEASVTWTLGPVPGDQALDAFSVRNDGDTVTVRVHARATAAF